MCGAIFATFHTQPALMFVCCKLKCYARLVQNIIFFVVQDDPRGLN